MSIRLDEKYSEIEVESEDKEEFLKQQEVRGEWRITVQEKYIAHLEDEIKFLRSLLSEQAMKQVPAMKMYPGIPSLISPAQDETPMPAHLPFSQARAMIERKLIERRARMDKTLDPTTEKEIESEVNS